MRRSLLSLLVIAFSLSLSAQPLPRIKTISRSFGPATGGTVITIDGNNLVPTVECLLPCPTTITFGDAQARLKGEMPSMLHVITPAHGPGTVDITIEIAGNAPIVLPNAFTFTTNAESEYEKVLLPIYFDGVLPGAHGSEWTTSLWIRNDGSDEARLAPWACEADVCGSAYPFTYGLQPTRALKRLASLSEENDGNPSRLVYVSQAQSADVSFSLRFADRSRNLSDAGIDLPVIRENEALYDAAQLFSVPLGPTFRAMLRLYELGDVSAARYRVSIYPQSEDSEVPAVHSEEMSATVRPGSFPSKAGYAQLDVTGLLRLQKEWPETARIEITPLTEGSRFWAFVSVTNNDTQIVTLVTPQ